jgi:hypothetical protein
MGIVPASANNPNTMIAEVAQVQATTMVPVVLAECKKQMHKLGADQVPSRFGCICRCSPIRHFAGHRAVTNPTKTG